MKPRGLVHGPLLLLRRVSTAIIVGLAMGAAGCAVDTDPSPFRGLVPHPLDGSAQPVRGNIASLGALQSGDVIRLRVDGDAVDDVLLLRVDALTDTQALVVGGGPANAPIDYPVVQPGTYLVFVPDGFTSPASSGSPLLIAAPGNPAISAPARQLVRVRFDTDFLFGPGLFDPVDGTDEDLALLQSLTPIVRDGILDRLRAVFELSPIVILGPDDPPSNEPESTLTFRADRVEAVDQLIVDAALPPPDPTRPECAVRVVFGEVLPRGVRQDTGNQTRDDAAVVYVGSFQGRGATCVTAASNSVSAMVLTLAQSGAHEIGHLLGLYHVEQIDLMNRSATLAFLRELGFERGQIQLERQDGEEVIGEVFPTIVQDPRLYFASIFDSQ